MLFFFCKRERFEDMKFVKTLKNNFKLLAQLKLQFIQKL